MEKFRSNLIACGSSQLVGKTTFANLFKELFELQHPDWTVIKESFAQPLRKELNDIVLPKFGVNLFNCNKEDKELFRPLMIEWAKIRRKQSQGTYYTSLLEDRIKNYDLLNFSPKDKTIFIIDDFRYTSEVSGYQEDEDTWIRKMGGVIVHLSRYTVLHDVEPFRFYIKPKIPDEIINNSVIERIADFRMQWETSDNIEERKKPVQNFINWFIQ